MRIKTLSYIRPSTRIIKIEVQPLQIFEGIGSLSLASAVRFTQVVVVGGLEKMNFGVCLPISS